VLQETSYTSFFKYCTYFFCAVMVFMTSGCIRDMDKQPSVRPFEETLQEFPADIISIHERQEIDRGSDYNTLSNPYERNDDSETEGRLLYNRYCSHCHGVRADGESPVGQSLGVHPENLLSSKIQSKSDGELYYIVTFGEEAMPLLKETVQPGERWLIIHHLRLLKEKQ